MNRLSRRHTVHFYQMRLFHYRVSLFEAMRRVADESGIDLHLICGQPSKSAATRKDEGALDWCHKVKNIYVPIEERKDLCWQPTPAGLPDPDLVVVMQENRILSNYPWLLKRAFGGPKIAYWGHGRDLQAGNLHSIRNRFKAGLARAVDWYFAYTDFTLKILLQDGFPEERITVVNNAIDTTGLRLDINNVPDDLLGHIRTELDLRDGELLGIYCGSLYPDKMLPLLVDACAQVHAKHPGFRLVIIGHGPSVTDLSALLTDKSWARWVGVKRGIEKAAYFRLANMMLNPGLVGLHVLDAFAAGIPLLTTQDARHSPEIAYLVDGRNGVITKTSASDFADAIESLVSDPERLNELARAAVEDGHKYSIQEMAERFVDGMVACLLNRTSHD
jgi:glycosyltransferase involved in cell wall biosynthesis